MVVNALKINTTTEKRGGFPDGAGGKESTCQFGRCKIHGFDPWIGKIPWRREWLPTPVFSPIKSRGQRSLTGYNPWGHQELDTNDRLNTRKRGGGEVASSFPPSGKVSLEKRLEGGKAMSHTAI